MTASLPTESAAVAAIETASRFSVRKIGLTLLAIGGATAVTVMGSSASWTAQTSNAGNELTAGTLSLTNDKNGSALFTAANIKPGDGGSSAVKLKNAGSIPIGVTLSQDQVVNGLAATSMKLQVHDATRNWCYYPTNAAGACTTFGTWSDSTKLSALALLATDGSAKWAANEEHTLNVSWKLDLSSPNTDQGKSASFRFVFDGAQ